MALDLVKVKQRRDAVLNLKKSKGIEDQKARVVLVLDYSGSMTDLYRNGTVQDTVERILPLGLAFDDDGEVDVYIFENGSRRIPDNVTLKNLNGYVDNNIWGKYSMGGTEYAPVMRDVLKKFGNTSGGFLGIGGSTKAAEIPTYVIFITDGENDQDDKGPAEKIIREAANHGIFWQFVGIGWASFNFLQKLDDISGRTVDNADFFKISDIRAESDATLYPKLMNEFPGWLKAARTAGVLK